MSEPTTFNILTDVFSGIDSKYYSLAKGFRSTPLPLNICQISIQKHRDAVVLSAKLQEFHPLQLIFLSNEIMGFIPSAARGGQNLCKVFSFRSLIKRSWTQIEPNFFLYFIFPFLMSRMVYLCQNLRVNY